MLFILKEIIRLMRVRQYIKNTFVFVGVIFARQWDTETLISAGLVFISFCSISSAVYVLNDLVDAESDRLHPTKKRRPIASGSINTRTAIGLCIVLVILSLMFASLVNPIVVYLVMTYACINIAYSFRLKHIAILDVFIISSGFMIRILSGTLGLAITPSSWLLLCGLMLTLFLGFAKRYAELRTVENINHGSKLPTRPVLHDYTSLAIEQFISISAACTIISYGLYSVSSETIEKHGSSELIYTLPFVIYGIFRYILILHMQDKGHDTAQDLYSDRHMIITVIAWLLTAVTIMT